MKRKKKPTRYAHFATFVSFFCKQRKINKNCVEVILRQLDRISHSSKKRIFTVSTSYLPYDLIFCVKRRRARTWGFPSEMFASIKWETHSRCLSFPSTHTDGASVQTWSFNVPATPFSPVNLLSRVNSFFFQFQSTEAPSLACWWPALDQPWEWTRNKKKRVLGFLLFFCFVPSLTLNFWSSAVVSSAVVEEWTRCRWQWQKKNEIFIVFLAASLASSFPCWFAKRFN